MRLVGLAVAAWAGAAVPAVAFDGRLLLPDGVPAAGFQVAVIGRTGSVPTDADGRFRVTPDPALPAQLLATDPTGKVWSPVLLEVLPASGEVAELQLDPTFREEVTIAAGVAPSIDAPPAAGTVVLGREDLEQRRPDHLHEALAGVAGASKSGEGADSVPALRGLPKGRTLILIDGARVTAERRAGASATFLDPFTLATLEVARGPGSVVYGSDAFGGVLDARTRDPEPGRFHLRYDLAGAFAASDLVSGGVEVSGDVGEHGGLLAVVHARDAGDGEGGGGEPIANSSFRDRGAALRYVHQGEAGRLRLSLGSNRVRDLGKASSNPANVTVYPEENADRFTASFVRGATAGFDELLVEAFLGRYEITLDRERQPNPTTTRRLDRSALAANDGSLRAQLARGLAGGRLGVGTEVVRRFDLEALTTRVSYDAADRETGRADNEAIGEASQQTVGVFATWDRPFGERFTLGLGVRADAIDSDNRGGFYGDRSESDRAVSGHLAGTLALPGGASLALQAASGFRVPTLSDRYFRGPSGRGFVTGNPELEAERSTQFDAAFRLHRGPASVAFYGYHYRIANLVERFGAGQDFFFRNRGEAELYGVELEGRLALPAGFAVEAAVASARGKARDDGAPLDDIAAPGGSVTLRWAGRHGYAYLRTGAFGRDERPGPTELARPGFVVADLGAGWRFSEALEIRLVAHNLADRRYVEAGDEEATLAPGRSITLGLSGRL